MAIDEFQLHKVKRALTEFCATRIPEHARSQIRLDYQIRGNNVTFFENRKHYRLPDVWTKAEIAQFRYNPDDKLWSLYWRRHTERWYRYDLKEPTADFEDLIAEVDKDPPGIFWG